MAHSHSHPSNPHGAAAGTMNLKKIITVGVVALVTFTAGIIWAYFIMVGERKEIGEKTGVASVATETGKAEIGIVDQVLFEVDHRLVDWKAEHSKKLGSYGWVDRAKGVARMPIEEAMRKVIASPPDIAGEGVPPAAAPPAAPPAAPVEEAGHKGGGKAAKPGKTTGGTP